MTSNWPSTAVSPAASVSAPQSFSGFCCECACLSDTRFGNAVLNAARAASVTTALESQDVAHRLNLRLVDLFHQAPFLLTPTVAGHTPVGSASGLVCWDGARFSRDYARGLPEVRVQAACACTPEGDTEAGARLH